MELNRVIRGTLDMIGRLSSALTTPTDWVDDLHHEEFSFKMAAYAAGMGEFGTGGSFLINGKYGGRLGAVYYRRKLRGPFRTYDAAAAR